MDKKPIRFYIAAVLFFAFFNLHAQTWNEYLSEGDAAKEVIYPSKGKTIRGKQYCFVLSVPNKADFDLELRDEDGELLKASETTSRKEYIFYNFAWERKVKLIVRPSKGEGNYELKASYGNCEDDYCNSYSQEFYEFQLEENSNFIITVNPINCDIDIELYDPKMYRVANSHDKGFVEEYIDYRVLLEGTYIVKIISYNDECKFEMCTPP